jgi:probable rRNA maturation factor
MTNISVQLKDPRWKKALHPYCKTVESACASIKAKGEVAVVLADDAFVRELNKIFRGKNKATNVLSFPNDEEPLGDIILSFETVEREAKAQGKSFKAHAIHLIVHGMLHLLGHDHEDDNQAEHMEALEVKILKKLGIANPYL